MLALASSALVLLTVFGVVGAQNSDEWADPAMASTASVIAFAALLWRRVREHKRELTLGPALLLVTLSVAALALSGLGIAYGGTGTRIYLTMFSINQVLAVWGALWLSRSAPVEPRQG